MVLEKSKENMTPDRQRTLCHGMINLSCLQPGELTIEHKIIHWSSKSSQKQDIANIDSNKILDFGYYINKCLQGDNCM